MQNRVRLLTTITTFLLITLLTLLTLTGCSNPGLTPGQGTDTDNNATGTVRFSWSDGSQTASRSRANNILDADKVVITIEAADGTVVYNQKQLNLYNFNGSFISEPLSLKVGSYRLTEYLILNSTGTVIFATPKAGSAQAHLVTVPLPHDFTVTKDGTTKVKPQVVDAATVTPAEFGYTGFTFEEAKIFNLLVSAMIYDATADSLVLTDASMDVTVATKAYSFALTNGTNKVTVNDIAGSYTVTIKKAGYDNYVAAYTNAEMKGFFQTPLTVMLTKKADTTITFADPNLEAAVRTAIAKPTGELYSSDVAALTKLDAYTKQITSLAGIENLTALTSLNLADNSIADIGQLAALTRLTTLRLHMNKINDLTPLASLTELSDVNLYSNSLTDITPLSTAAKLTILNIANNKISDLAPLQSLTELQQLTISNNIISNIGPLSGLSKLGYLHLSGNNISDIGALSAVTNLTYLNLSTNSISDISSLTGLTKLTTLYLDNNSILDLTPLSSITVLNILYLHKNGLSEIGPLSTLTELATLTLSDNTITNISALSPLTKLNLLILRNNSITDISPLVNNTGLGSGNSVYLETNPLSADAKTVQIPALQARGVNVKF